jgi:hypothetical protein
MGLPVLGFLFLSSADVTQLTELQTPFAADLKGAADVWAIVVMAATVFGDIEPDARAVDDSMIRPISRLGLLWRGQQTVIVRVGVRACDGTRHAVVELQKKWRMAHASATGAAAVAIVRCLAWHLTEFNPISRPGCPRVETSRSILRWDG